jgi:hypothetical protein
MSHDTAVKGADQAPRVPRQRVRRLARAMRRHKWRSGIAVVGVLAMLLTVGMFAAAEIWKAIDDRKAAMTTDGPYQGTVESLNSHRLPDWYAGAKLGIMIHWGPYSVPGFAPKGTFAEVLRTDYDHAMVSHPYAEDYQNAMKDPDSPTGRYHAEHYGTLPYEEFGKQFESGLAKWNADEWAKTFHDTGARYVVMVAKYADGYSLWPTDVVNPNQPDWHSRRDLVGELATAVRKLGMKFGVYYSGGVDWTFQRHIVRTLGPTTATTPTTRRRRFASSSSGTSPTCCGTTSFGPPASGACPRSWPTTTTRFPTVSSTTAGPPPASGTGPWASGRCAGHSTH